MIPKHTAMSMMCFLHRNTYTRKTKYCCATHPSHKTKNCLNSLFGKISDAVHNQYQSSIIL